MQLLHTTDLHFNKSWFEWIAKQQDKFDIFCITGDFLDSSQDESIPNQIDWVSDWIKGFKKPLFVCSGNHDIEDFENEDWLNNINTSNYYPDDRITTINSVKIGSVPFIVVDFLDFYECDILLYHIPPSATKTSILKTDNNDWGDKELRNLLQKKFLTPKYVLCGHVHNPLGSSDKIHETTIYNPYNSEDSDIPNCQIITL